EQGLHGSGVHLLAQLDVVHARGAGAGRVGLDPVAAEVSEQSLRVTGRNLDEVPHALAGDLPNPGGLAQFDFSRLRVMKMCLDPACVENSVGRSLSPGSAKHHLSWSSASS